MPKYSKQQFKEDLQNRLNRLDGHAQSRKNKINFMVDLLDYLRDARESSDYYEYYETAKETFEEYLCPRTETNEWDIPLLQERTDDLAVWMNLTAFMAGEIIFEKDEENKTLNCFVLGIDNSTMHGIRLNTFEEVLMPLIDYVDIDRFKMISEKRNEFAEEVLTNLQYQYERDEYNPKVTWGDVMRQKNDDLSLKKNNQARLNMHSKMDLSFISDPEFTEQLRMNFNNTMQKHLNTRTPNAILMEQIKNTEKILDATGKSGSETYMAVRNGIKNLKEAINSYGKSWEVEKAQEQLIAACKNYQDAHSTPRRTSDGTTRLEAISELRSATLQSLVPDNRDRWNSSVANLNTMTEALKGLSGTRKGLFGRIQADSPEFTEVLDLAKSLAQRAREASNHLEDPFYSSLGLELTTPRNLRADSIDSLRMDLMKSCERYLSAKNPNSTAGKERYSAVQKLWNAACGFDTNYLAFYGKDLEAKENANLSAKVNLEVETYSIWNRQMFDIPRPEAAKQVKQVSFKELSAADATTKPSHPKRVHEPAPKTAKVKTV